MESKTALANTSICDSERLVGESINEDLVSTEMILWSWYCMSGDHNNKFLIQFPCCNPNFKIKKSPIHRF